MNREYFYMPRGRKWAVYRYEDSRRMIASKVNEYFTFDEARREVYRLNGWKDKTI